MKKDYMLYILMIIELATALIFFKGGNTPAACGWLASVITIVVLLLESNGIKIVSISTSDN